MQEKPEYLINPTDKLHAKLERSDARRIAMKISIDMWEIHQKECSKMDKFHILIDYFKERQGIWDVEASCEEDMAMKMILMGEIVEVQSDIAKITQCRPDDMNIHFKIIDQGGFEVTCGIHKRVSDDMRNILEKLCDIHIKMMLDNIKNNYPGIFVSLERRAKKHGHKLENMEYKKPASEQKVEFDKDVEKILNGLDIDKSNMGEA